MTPTDCTVAHTAERITTGMVKAPDLTGPATAKDSCTRQAAQVTGHVDPTMGGRLTVSLTISGIDHAEFSIQRAVDCVLITADGRRILGSLVGLDDQPLHYAG